MIDQERQSKQRQIVSQPGELTGFGLTTKLLWLLISVNALISAAISLLMVLVVGPWAFSGSISGLFTPTGEGGAPPISQLQGTPLDLLDATPTQTATLTPTPIPEPILYEVVAGDSLSGIATRFEVSMEAIMAANGLDDPDSIQAGQSLLIPVGGQLDTTATQTPEPQPTETPIPFDPPTPEGGDFTTPPEDVSLQATPSPTPIPTATAPPLDQVQVEIDTVLGYGQVDQEMVIIANQGPGINLSGWTLRGSAQGPYQFPNLFLWSGGSVRIHTGPGTSTSADLYWGQAEPRWLSGDLVELVDAGGEVISTYTIP